MLILDVFVLACVTVIAGVAGGLVLAYLLLYIVADWFRSERKRNSGNNGGFSS